MQDEKEIIITTALTEVELHIVLIKTRIKCMHIIQHNIVAIKILPIIYSLGKPIDHWAETKLFLDHFICGTAVASLTLLINVFYSQVKVPFLFSRSHCG